MLFNINFIYLRGRDYSVLDYFWQGAFEIFCFLTKQFNFFYSFASAYHLYTIATLSDTNFKKKIILVQEKLKMKGDFKQKSKPMFKTSSRIKDLPFVDRYLAAISKDSHDLQKLCT